jgi:3',5'-cyclic AMP phosphodiesterase CpdA
VSKTLAHVSDLHFGLETRFQSHGLVHDEDLRELDDALCDPDPRELVVVTMHHHPLPLPEESSLERLSAWLRLPFTTELAMGRELLACLRGRCDLLLHGHRHVPGERELFGDDPRPLQVVDAGSSTEMRRVRVFEHHDGRPLGPSRWLHAPERQSAKRISPCSPPSAMPSAWPRAVPPSRPWP